MYDSTFRYFSYDEIADWEFDDLPDYVDSVLAFGVFQPILITEDNGIPYLIAGNRRLASFKKACEIAMEAGELPPHLAQGIPARVYQGVSANDRSAWALIENEERGDNDVRTWRLIHDAQERGDWEQVQELVKLNKATITRIMTLDKVLPEIVDGYYSGKVAQSTLFTIAKLPAARQEFLREVMEEKGKISGTDVKEAKQVVRTASLSGLQRPQPSETASNGLNKFVVFNGQLEGPFDDVVAAVVWRDSNQPNGVIYRLVKVSG